MTPQERLIQTAMGEVGYLEKRNNYQLDNKTANAGSANYTKYARDLDAIKGFYNGRKQGTSWCDVWVDWCFVHTFGVETALKLLCAPMGSCGAGCKYSAQYYKAKGRFREDGPQPGDQIFFVKRKGLAILGWLHTGIVEKVEGGYVYTIEGNTSGASGVVANGGGVCRKKYKLNDASIGGYGRPDWNLVKEEIEMTKDEVIELVNSAVQEALERSEEPKTYDTVDACPEWARQAVSWAVGNGYIKGDEHGRLRLDDHKIWAIQKDYNMMTKKA